MIFSLFLTAWWKSSPTSAATDPAHYGAAESANNGAAEAAPSQETNEKGKGK